jgi:hypothetical protein
MLATLAIAPLVRQFEEIANRVDQTAAVPAPVERRHVARHGNQRLKGAVMADPKRRQKRPEQSGDVLRDAIGHVEMLLERMAGPVEIGQLDPEQPEDAQETENADDIEESAGDAAEDEVEDEAQDEAQDEGDDEIEAEPPNAAAVDTPSGRVAAASRGSAVRAEALRLTLSAQEEAHRLRSEASELRATAAAEGERILAEAQEVADSVLVDAQQEADERRAEADQYLAEAQQAADQRLEQAQAEADEYADRSRSEADEYADRVRSEADEEAARIRTEAEQAARERQAATDRSAAEKVATATKQAQRIRDEARAAGRAEAIAAIRAEIRGALTEARSTADRASRDAHELLDGLSVQLQAVADHVRDLSAATDGALQLLSSAADETGTEPQGTSGSDEAREASTEIGKSTPANEPWSRLFRKSGRRED